jgi:hypothetical protein
MDVIGLPTSPNVLYLRASKEGYYTWTGINNAAPIPGSFTSNNGQVY